jgi:hypothetical protein
VTAVGYFEIDPQADGVWRVRVTVPAVEVECLLRVEGGIVVHSQEPVLWAERRCLQDVKAACCAKGWHMEKVT